MRHKSLVVCGVVLSMMYVVGVQKVSAANLEVNDWSHLKNCLIVDGNTCRLTDNVIAAETLTLSSGTVELDLNGKNLDLGAYHLKVNTAGSLTINDATKSGIITSTDKRTLQITKGGKLNLNSGIVKNDYADKTDGSTIQVWGNEDIDGPQTYLKIGRDATAIGNAALGVFWDENGKSNDLVIDVYGSLKGTPVEGITDGNVGIAVNGNITAITGDVPVINIYDGALIQGAKGTTGNHNKDAYPAIYAAGFAKFNISGGTLKGSEALSIKSGEFNISGGIFIADGTFVSAITSYTGGTEATGAAISITKNSAYAGKVKLNITDATVSSTNGYAVYEGDTATDTGTVVQSIEINGGTFIGNENVGSVYSKAINNFVNGGTYNADLTPSYLSTNLDVIRSGNEFIVGVAHNITINSVDNGSITTSLQKGVNGQEITITVNPDTGYKLKGITGAVLRKVNENSYAFIVGDEDITLTPVFESSVVEVNTTAESVIENPKTSDSVLVSLIIAVISIIGIIGGSIYLKHNVNN